MVEEGGGFGAGFGGEVVDAATQEAEGFFGEGAHGAVHGALVPGGKGFGGEGGVGEVGGKSGVHFGGTTTEKAGGLEVGADGILHSWRHLGAGKVEEVGAAREIKIEVGVGVEGVVVGRDGSEGVAPGIALVGDEALEDGEGLGLGDGGGVVFDGACEGRGVWEGLLPEEAADLQLGTDTIFEATE